MLCEQKNLNIFIVIAHNQVTHGMETWIVGSFKLIVFFNKVIGIISVHT